MLDNFMFDNIDTFDDIDTSDVEICDSDGDSSDFFESFEPLDGTDFMCYDDIDSFASGEHLNMLDEDTDIAEDVHSHCTEQSNHTSHISFGSLVGRCHHYNCLCRQFEGTYGAVCKNCYHGFDKHY